MKRILGVVLTIALLAGMVPAHSAAATSTNNFRISSYDIQYELSRNSEGRSVLKTTETITAEFPSYDQNHGIERALPTSYESHPTELVVNSVTNAAGEQLEYSTTDEGTLNSVKLLRVGNAQTYVHGTQTYRITYTQQDVTRFYKDTARDEWYWDTNGTEWRVPIDLLTVKATFEPSLASARVGEPFCYQGASNVNETCQVTSASTGVYTATVTNLAAGENMTVAFGFKEGTFVDYKMPLSRALFFLWVGLQAISGLIGLIFLIVLIVLAARRYNRASETNPIVAEYIPPKNASVTVASQVATEKSRAVFSAQLIDLAVRHYINIVETREKSLLKSAEYDIEVINDVSTLKDEEKEILTDMFGHEPKPGERLALKTLKNNLLYMSRTTDNVKKLRTLIHETYALRAKSPETSKVFYRWAKGLLIAAVPLLSLGLAFVALVAFIIGKTLRPLTDEGLALRRYVLGLDKYIKASETERLKFLQGPDTAEKVGFTVNPEDPGQLVKLYERTLPYAVLFGREKQWSKRLGEFYQTTQTNPDWYTSQGIFNAALFSASMSNFSQASAMAAGYSAGSSSSSGGSGGGGFSGGGGGGGGGGGW